MTDRPGRVQGKVAIVTGAASGLGAASARRLAEEGASVMLTDRSVAAGEAVAEAILAIGGKAAFMAHDVVSETDWEAVTAGTRRRSRARRRPGQQRRRRRRGAPFGDVAGRLARPAGDQS